jgi:alanine racemase
MSLANSAAVSVDLSRIRNNAEAIVRSTGVPMLAVVKADAYGLGAVEVAEAIGDLVQGFYVFDAAEAVSTRLWDIAGKRIVTLNSSWVDPDDFVSQHISPVVWSMDRARELRRARPVLSVDTGQQRFSCPVEDAASVRQAGDCREAMTHAITLPQVGRFVEVVQSWDAGEVFCHAAGSALLDEPAARLDAVRPGLALYRGAVRVTVRLVDARNSSGPAGYTGFIAPRIGVILAGYSGGLRPGPCMVNGQLRRVAEVGMQSSFIELGPEDRTGDEVVLLGSEPEISESAVARAWRSSPQEVLVRLTRLSLRNYCRG